MGVNSKRKLSKASNEDRISALPDAILCHILSFLPTVYVVTTCVLSRRWQNVWTSVPNLELSVSPPNSDSGRSAGFVDRVLFFRGPLNIHRFQLSGYRPISNDLWYRFDAWICIAIKRNVVELDLNFHGNGLIPPGYHVLPRSIFKCKTLEVLKLQLGEYIAPIAPTSNCFPSLKYLHVTIFNPKVVFPLEKLFSCCPVLEDLIIEGYLGTPKDGATLKVTVSAPKLKRLAIRMDNAEEVFENVELYQYNFYIMANVPNLEELEVDENFLANYSLNAKSLKKAKIKFCVHEEDLYDDGFLEEPVNVENVHKFLGEISSVEDLSFSAPLLGDSLFIGHKQPLPTLKNVIHLEILSPTCCSWEAMKTLLMISPNVEHLVLQNNVVCACKQNFNHEFCPPETVPACLATRLKTVYIRGFEGRRQDVEVAEYLLKHGDVLEKMTISACDFSEDLVKTSVKFPDVPRSSKSCEVECIF